MLIVLLTLQVKRACSKQLKSVSAACHAGLPSPFIRSSKPLAMAPARGTSKQLLPAALSGSEPADTSSCTAAACKQHSSKAPTHRRQHTTWYGDWQDAQVLRFVWKLSCAHHTSDVLPFSQLHKPTQAHTHKLYHMQK